MSASNQVLSLVLPKKLQGLFRLVHKSPGQIAETTHEVASMERTFVLHSIAKQALLNVQVDVLA